MKSYLQAIRTSFLLYIVISTFSVSSAAKVQRFERSITTLNRLPGPQLQNTKSHQLVSTNHHLLDRRRRESLPQQQVSSDENAEIGSVIFSVPGSDSADRFSHREPVNPRFRVDERTGNIILLEALDFETSPQEIVNVEITSTNKQGKSLLFIFFYHRFSLLMLNLD